MIAHTKRPLGLLSIELVQEAFCNLRDQRQRSALAVLGILIGTASIVAMLLIGNIAQFETLKLFKHLGVDMVELHATATSDTWAGLDRQSIERLAQKYPAVEIATPMLVHRSSAAAGTLSADVDLVGVTATFSGLVALPLNAGRLIGSADDENLIAVIGAAAAQKLSAVGAPLVPGGEVVVQGYVFTVVGVLDPIPYTALDPADLNNAVIIPLGTAPRVVAAANPDVALIRLRHDSDAKAVGDQLARALTNPTSAIQVLSAKALIKGLTAQKTINGRLLAATGGISLLVGGIGVMNVMLMGVMERRREIGLRAAIGATHRDLQTMFLVEAAVISGVGGVLGLIFGLLAAYVTSLASGWTFRLAIYVVPLGMMVSLVVGIAFGLYPAIKASRLDPIQALRGD